MESEKKLKPRNAKLKIAIDILSVGLVAYLVIVVPIWAHYDLGPVDPNEPMPLVMKLFFASGIPALCGIGWLAWRYHNTEFVSKFASKMTNTQYFLQFIVSCIVLYFVGGWVIIEILNTLRR